MPRLPKNFEIAWVSIDELAPAGYLSTSPDSALPTRFQANFWLTNPEVAVTIEVAVGADLRPVVLSANVKGTVKAPVTTSIMRQMLIDQLVNAAVEKAIVPASVREEWLATLPPGAVPTDRNDGGPTASAGQLVQNRADDGARRAAQIYSEAVEAGNRAPAVAVAKVMNRSRGQAARYIRRARELGLLPPLDSSEEA